MIPRKCGYDIRGYKPLTLDPRKRGRVAAHLARRRLERDAAAHAADETLGRLCDAPLFREGGRLERAARVEQGREGGGNAALGGGGGGAGGLEAPPLGGNGCEAGGEGLGAATEQTTEMSEAHRALSFFSICRRAGRCSMQVRRRKRGA